MEERMITGKDFLRGEPLRVSDQHVCVGHHNNGAYALHLIPSTSLLREGSTILRLNDIDTTNWPTFMHSLSRFLKSSEWLHSKTRLCLNVTLQELSRGTKLQTNSSMFFAGHFSLSSTSARHATQEVSNTCSFRRKRPGPKLHAWALFIIVV